MSNNKDCYMDEKLNNTNDCRTMEGWKFVYGWIYFFCNGLSWASVGSLLYLVINVYRYYNRMEIIYKIGGGGLIILHAYITLLIFILNIIADKKVERPEYDHVKEYDHFFLPNLENILAVILVTIVGVFILLFCMYFYIKDIISLPEVSKAPYSAIVPA